MAIRIPILTSFDPKGLKSANAAFGNLQGSVRSLGSNFAALGVALAGAGALIAKNVQSLARIETINAQTAQTIKSMGNASNISAKEVEALAGSLEALTATEAETIQQGANLLLTFRNISNQAGAGNDIFNQTTAIMVDMGRALGEDAAASAIRLGKALNDPIRGLTALRKVGVGFTTEQENQIKAMQNSGDIMGAQKVILAELQAQFGGSGAAFANTFTGQLELMGHELGTIGEEATMAVMPALQGMVAELRELIPIIGPQLKAAIESVDWKGLTTSVVGLTTFLIQNAETIARVIAAVFLLNTAFKLLAVASGVVKVAIALQTWFTAQLASGMTLATVASTILSAAMRLIPFVAVATAIGFVVTGIIQLGDETKRNKPYVDNYGGAIRKSGDDALWAAQRYGTAANAANALGNSLGYVQAIQNKLTPRQADELIKRTGREFVRIPNLPDFSGFSESMGGGGAVAAITEPIVQGINEVNDAQAEAARKEQEILEKRKSAFESFSDSVKQLFGQIKDSILSSFNLPTLGNSVNSITRNISKLLERTKNFAKNISQLSGMGLNSALLQQVIQAGPMAGSQLASALVGGGSGFVEQINRAYTDFGNLAGGIAGVGTTGAFANQQTVNNYSIEVTGGLATGSDVGRAVVNAIRDYERQSGAAWRA
jgi:hypothetical protein